MGATAITPFWSVTFSLLLLGVMVVLTLWRDPLRRAIARWTGSSGNRSRSQP